MFRNYFYLNRAVIELNEKLLDLKVEEIFTQEKNRLYFSIGDSEYPYRHLVISTDQSLPYFQIKNEHHKARKNAVNFFKDFLPDEIKKIEIAENDRVIKFTLLSSEIFFMIRGKDTNVIIAGPDNHINSFKKISKHEQSLLSELRNLIYSNNAILPDFTEWNIQEFDYSSIKKVFPQITKDIFNEVKARIKNDSKEEFIKNLTDIILKVFSEDIAVFYDESENRTFFCPVSFSLSQNHKKKEITDSYLRGINKYFAIRYKNERTLELTNEIKKFLDKELTRTASKLNNLKKRIDEGSKEEVYRKYGSLLLGNIHLLKEKKEHIIVNNYLSGDDIEIKLNPKIQPKQNIDWYFEKSKDERISYSKSKEIHQSTKDYYNNLLKVKDEFEASDDIDSLTEVKEKLKIKTAKQSGKKLEDKIKFRHYLIDEKYHVFVGRDSKSNDLLSTKFVKQNDYWFHARGLPGSHVVLRTDNPKEGIPKNIIKKAASITGFYSKAKTAGTAPIAYTFGKYVYKKKGMEPGQVIVTKEKVLLVKPEIPDNCILQEE